MPTVTELPQRTSRSASDSLGVFREQTRTFRVINDAVSDGADGARLATGVPRLGDFNLPDDPQSFAQNVDAVPVANESRRFEVTVFYSTRSPSGATPSDDGNPLTVDAVTRWATRTGEEEVVKEVDRDGEEGRAITNSARDLFDPSVKRSKGQLILTITRNESVFTPALWEAWIDVVNSVTWVIQNDPLVTAAARTAKIASINADPQTVSFQDSEITISFFRVTTEVSFIKGGWQPVLVDQGFAEFAAFRGRTEIKDDNENVVTTPQLLDGTGLVLGVDAQGDPKTPINMPRDRPDNDPGFHIYDEAPFSDSPFVQF